MDGLGQHLNATTLFLQDEFSSELERLETSLAADAEEAARAATEGAAAAGLSGQWIISCRMPQSPTISSAVATPALNASQTKWQAVCRSSCSMRPAAWG